MGNTNYDVHTSELAHFEFGDLFIDIHALGEDKILIDLEGNVGPVDFLDTIRITGKEGRPFYVDVVFEKVTDVINLLSKDFDPYKSLENSHSIYTAIQNIEGIDVKYTTIGAEA